MISALLSNRGQALVVYAALGSLPLLLACASDGDPPGATAAGTAASTGQGPGGGPGSGGSGAQGGAGSSGGEGGAAHGGSGGGGTGTTGGAGGEGGAGGCSAFTVDIDALRAESIARLDAFFGPSAAYEQGQLWFDEGLSAHDGCPSYAPFDHTSVVFVADIDPALVPPEVGPRKAGVSWGLNGLADIWLVPADAPPPSLRYNARYPVSGIVMFDAGTSPAQRDALHAALTAAYPTADIQNLSAVGMLVYDFGDGQIDGNEPPGLYADVLEFLDDVRNAPEVSVVEIDGFVFTVPMDFAPATLIDDAVHELAPECLRTNLTLPFVGKFVGSESFPTPFGQGWQLNATPCQ